MQARSAETSSAGKMPLLSRERADFPAHAYNIVRELDLLELSDRSSRSLMRSGTSQTRQSWWKIEQSDPARLVVMRLDNTNQERDTKITVFNKVFHVHSTILKEKSLFFETFMDLPERPKTPESHPEKFKYDYVTVEDRDGSWGLEARNRVGLRYLLFLLTSALFIAYELPLKGFTIYVYMIHANIC